MEVPEQSRAAPAEGTATATERKWPREEFQKIWKECKEESFWYRALPLSVASMAATGGFIYGGVWKAAGRLGPFPKLAAAGILGYAVGKASYFGACREKFHRLGPEFGPGHGPGFGPGFGRGSGPRHCHHVCDECKKQQTPTQPAAPAQS